MSGGPVLSVLNAKFASVSGSDPETIAAKRLGGSTCKLLRVSFYLSENQSMLAFGCAW